MKTHLNDDDYVLDEGAGWFDVKGFAVRIHATDEGVVVDVFDSKALGAGVGMGEPLASTWAHDNDLMSDDELENQDETTAP